MGSTAVSVTTRISVGHATLVAARTQRVAELADMVAAMSLEAVGGNISVVGATIGVAKAFQGQIDAAEHVRTVLEGSYLQSHAFETVQEALSFRVVPQVHGTLREVLRFAIAAVETELNAAAVPSRGPFHGAQAACCARHA